ncbi:helix-turn-helix domain-containing protein [Streptomyces sp. NPDC059467]|uniref:helix-turn-helix domain-containing protein n=1 Tax=Streptomyces sp. NPDC059467 TaxID=3346844 RepID=UPI0036C38272
MWLEVDVDFPEARADGDHASVPPNFLQHPREALLQENVRVYLECNCSPATAAARLDVVKNTVVYRIRRAEQMQGRSVKEQQGILWAALHLVDVVDPVESQYSA